MSQQLGDGIKLQQLQTKELFLSQRAALQQAKQLGYQKKSLQISKEHLRLQRPSFKDLQWWVNNLDEQLDQ